MNSAGGTRGNGDDTYVTVSDAGGWSYDATKKEWIRDSSVQANSFRLNTGSIVSAVDPKPINNDRYFNTLKINGVDYKIESVSDIDLIQENGNLVVKLITNAGDVIASDEIKIGDFNINYGNGTPGQPGQPGQPGEQGPSGQTGEQGQPGQSGTGNQTTIEQAINKNYTNITNNTIAIENIQNEYVTKIEEGADGHTWNVYQTGEAGNITIQDTTLVEKRLMPGSVPNASPNNALSYDFDPNTGIPQVFIEFEDTSGNVVQGAIDTGALMAMTVDTTDGNIEVDFNGQGFGRSYSLSRNVDIHESVTIANVVKIDGDGIDMGDTKITELADGRIAPDSKDAINGSQLWETNRNMDKLGGRLDKVGAGAAALAALHPLDFDPDDKLQFSAGVGNYKGETAAAIGAFYRPTEKVMFSVAGTMGNGENMVNAGVTFALDRKNNVSNSRVAMAHEIKDLRDQVAALTALVSQIAGKGNPLLDTVMFPDVPENHWAYDYVENLQKRGIIEGYPDGNFGGDRSCTRYEYAAMLYRALEKGFPVDGRLLKEFEAELGRIRIDRIKGADDDANKVERVRVNDYEDRDDYGSKLAQVVANAAPAIEEEPAA